jgi:hypothetical protein
MQVEVGQHPSWVPIQFAQHFPQLLVRLGKHLVLDLVCSCRFFLPLSPRERLAGAQHHHIAVTNVSMKNAHVD